MYFYAHFYTYSYCNCPLSNLYHPTHHYTPLLNYYPFNPSTTTSNNLFSCKWPDAIEIKHPAHSYNSFFLPRLAQNSKCHPLTPARMLYLCSAFCFFCQCNKPASVPKPSSFTVAILKPDRYPKHTSIPGSV